MTPAGADDGGFRDPGRWEELDRVVAGQRVRPPAIGLIVVGAIIILSGVAGPAFFGAMFLLEEFPPPGEERNMLLAFGGVMSFAALLALALGVTIIIGGYRMFYLRSWTLALVSSILSIIGGVASMGSVLVCCVFGVFGLFGVAGVPVGIWSLVVLNDPVIRTAFR